MRKLDHIHTFVRYRKMRPGGTTGKKEEWFYRCAHPDCGEVKSRTFLKGKRSMCAVCGQNPIILDYEALRRAKPNCPECSNTKKSRDDLKERAAKNARKEEKQAKAVANAEFRELPKPVQFYMKTLGMTKEEAFETYQESLAKAEERKNRGKAN
jgi:hypothetical protein